MDDTIKQVQSLLDKEDIRYISIIHSKAYLEEEILVNDYNLGHELVNTVLIKINKEDMAMIVVPSTRKISLESLQKEFANTNISFIGKKEVAKLFPHYEAGTLPPLGQLYNIPVFCIDELLKMPEVTFYLGTYTHRIRMKTADFFKITEQKIAIHAITTPRYHAEIHSVNPFIEKHYLRQYKNCILGISLENKSFITAKLVGMVDWACQHFENCTVVIGDSIHRYTLEIKGLNEDYAYHKALRLGREILDINHSVFESYAEHCNIKIVLCSQIQQSPHYHHYYSQLENLYLTNPHFSISLQTFADTFVERRADLDENYYSESIKKSCIYLLEELAVFACLSDQGGQVFIYPGALNILIEIAEGLYPDAPDALKKLVYIALKIKRRGAS